MPRSRAFRIACTCAKRAQRTNKQYYHDAYDDVTHERAEVGYDTTADESERLIAF